LVNQLYIQPKLLEYSPHNASPLLHAIPTVEQMVLWFNFTFTHDRRRSHVILFWFVVVCAKQFIYSNVVIFDDLANKYKYLWGSVDWGSLNQKQEIRHLHHHTVVLLRFC
jgi:hypothetical protein